MNIFHYYSLSYTHIPVIKDAHSFICSKLLGSPQSISKQPSTTFHPNSFTSCRWYVFLHACPQKCDTQHERSQCRHRASHEGGSSSSNSIFSHTVDLMQSSHCLCWEMGSLSEMEFNKVLGHAIIHILKWRQMFLEIYSTNKPNKT